MRTYNLSKIMLKAWKVYRQNKEKGINFAESLHRAWLSSKAEEINAKRIEEFADSLIIKGKVLKQS
ncbi:MAG: hypothetical protein U0O03_13760 [Blautia wexlerae]|uniref:hypothetical protein n=1 Tax=Blautia wexlerae TaxID=418240 RepID=UPI000677CEFE|nr:hypothetical protein [Blautia wexlerae]